VAVLKLKIMNIDRYKKIRDYAIGHYNSMANVGAALDEDEGVLSNCGRAHLYLWELVTDKQQNVQDEPTAESAQAPAADAASENPAGGGSAPSPCSASGNESPEQEYIPYDFGELTWHDSSESEDTFRTHLQSCRALAQGRTLLVSVSIYEKGGEDDPMWSLENLREWYKKELEIRELEKSLSKNQNTNL
jgi:hypothetical protein